MKTTLLLFVLLLSIAAWTQTASVTMTGDSASCSVGNTVVGDASVACVVTVTNSTGSDFTWQQYDDASQQSTVGNYGTVQLDGHIMARAWGDSCNPSYLFAANPGTWTFTSGTSCTINLYAVPLAVGAQTGHLKLVNAAGTVLSTVTVTATGVADTNTTVALPTGITFDGTNYNGTVIDTTYPGDGSCTDNPVNSTQLSTALGLSNRIICLAKGSNITGTFTWSGSNSMLRSDDAGHLPAGIPAAGTRICAANGTGTNYNSNCTTMAANMATVTNALADNTPIFNVAGANNRFVGLELSGTSTAHISGDNTVFDRCYIHDNTLTGYGQIVASAAAIGYAVIDSWVETDTTIETQAMTAGQKNRKIKWVNNTIIGTGGTIIGGDIGVGDATNPTDIELRSNHVFRPTQWNPNCTGLPLPAGCNGTAWDGNNHTNNAKALVEFKEGARILATGNIFEQHISGQLYSPYLYSPGNQHGNNIFSRVTDVTSDRNIIRNSNVGLLFTAGGFGWPSLTTKRIYMHDTLAYGLCTGPWVYPNTGTNTDPACAILTTDSSPWGLPTENDPQAITNLTVTHNTLLDAGYTPLINGTASCGLAGTTDVTGFIFKDNIFSAGKYPVCVDNVLMNNVTFPVSDTASLYRTLYTTPVDAGNISGGNWAFHWGTASAWDPYEIWGGDQSGIGFTNIGTNYLLTAGSSYHNWASDGTDPGITAALYTATANTISGNNSGGGGGGSRTIGGGHRIGGGRTVH